MTPYTYESTVLLARVAPCLQVLFIPPSLFPRVHTAKGKKSNRGGSRRDWGKSGGGEIVFKRLLIGNISGGTKGFIIRPEERRRRRYVQQEGRIPQLEGGEGVE